MRTPVTIDRTPLEVTLSRPDASADLRRLGETLLAVNARHERLIDGLLILGRADRRIEHPVAVDLAEIVTHLAEQTRTQGSAGAAGGPDLRTDLRPCVVVGDPLLLERVVRNLLDNASAYNHPDGWVEVTTGPHGQGD
ncbi:MAG TPA: two-component sensor histidine kinase, partial [Actinopolymorphaceae bacterium]